MLLVAALIVLLIAVCSSSGRYSEASASAEQQRPPLHLFSMVDFSLGGCGLPLALHASLLLDPLQGTLTANLLSDSHTDTHADSHADSHVNQDSLNNYIAVQMWMWRRSSSNSNSNRRDFHSQILSTDPRFAGGLPMITIDLDTYSESQFSANDSTSTSSSTVASSDTLLADYSFQFRRLYRLDRQYNNMSYIDSTTYQCALSIIQRKEFFGSKPPLKNELQYPISLRWYYYQEKLLHRNFNSLHNFHCSWRDTTNNNRKLLMLLSDFNSKTRTHPTLLVSKAAIEKCLAEQKLVFIGDSHLKRISMLIGAEQCSETATCKYDQHIFFDHGNGIFHNVAADADTQAYIDGKVTPTFVKGKLLENLENGFYDKLATYYGYTKTWIINSGHWDMRDVSSIDEYVSRVALLFNKLHEFSSKHNIKIIWNSNPTFSYQQRGWKHREHRSNEDIIYANHVIRRLAREHFFEYIPFGELILPFASFSCDDHHYLCVLDANGNAVRRVALANLLGLVNANILFKSVCD